MEAGMERGGLEGERLLEEIRYTVRCARIFFVSLALWGCVQAITQLQGRLRSLEYAISSCIAPFDTPVERCRRIFRRR